jgi:hypothetical protein
LLSERQRVYLRVADEATNSDRHIVKATGGIQPWGYLIGQVSTRYIFLINSADLAERLHAWAASPCPDSTQSFVNQDPIAVIQGHKIRDRTECHEIEVFDNATGLTKLSFERCHQIESNADATEILPGELAAVQIRVNDRIRHRQLCAGKMVIGNQYIDVEFTCGGYTVDARNTVIDGHEQSRPAALYPLDNLSRQSITEFEAVGDKEAYFRKTEISKAQVHKRRTGRSIGIEVADNQNVSFSMPTKQLNGIPERVEFTDGTQTAKI